MLKLDAAIEDRFLDALNLTALDLEDEDVKKDYKIHSSFLQVLDRR